MTTLKALALTLAFLASFVNSAVWNGEVNKTWYTSNSSKTNFTITTPEQLAGLAELVNGGTTMSGKTITLGANIELNDTTGWKSWNSTTAGLSQWTPIGTSAIGKKFKGTFDGAGFVIRGLYISTDSDYQGLFGYDSAAVIKNVGLVSGYVKGGSYTGFLAGYNIGGEISHSYTSGNVNGESCIGGLAGYNGGGKISHSYALGNVNGGGGYAGGLLGANSGTISNSYASGNVTGAVSNVIGDVLGGLVGNNGGSINYSYYKSGSAGGAGTPKTTEEMKQKETFVTWDFVNTWFIDQRQGKEDYPKLLWSLFGGGNGTLGNPYIIITKEHLENLAILTNAGYSFQGKYISLGQDIALNDTTGWKSWNSTTAGLSQWTPIGTSSKKFKGTFDGAGFAIRGLYINTSNSYQGLFGYDSAAVIKNVGVIAGYVKGGSYTGFLAGYNGGTISNSYATGNVSGNDQVGGLVGGGGTIINSYATGSVSGTGYYVGGLAGRSDDTISNSYATGTVSGNNYVGGLAGYNSSAISNSYATGDVNSTGDYVGGLIGRKYEGTISNSYAKGNVNSTGSYVGGLAGSGGTISNSYAIGTVSGNNYVGGLAGYNSSAISNSYAMGSVSGTGDYVGGLAGNGSTISNSYAIGNVSGSGYVGGLAGIGSIISNSYAIGIVSGSDYVGGLVGENESWFSATSNSYYNIETSRQTNDIGIPKTTTEMQSQEMVDMLNLVASLERNNAWIYREGEYPKLSNSIAPEINIANYFESGDGTLGNPYIIITKKQLELLAIFTNTGHTFIGEYISLGQDIALNDTNQNEGWRNWGTNGTELSKWTPIGTRIAYFKGTFDGAGFVISGLYINSNKRYQGLFSRDSAAVIKNVRMIAGYVKGDSSAGFLVGENRGGTISNSYAVGNVSGDHNVGGLIGHNYEGTISNSYVIGDVSGNGGVGGLTGDNYEGVISNSYAHGNVNSTGDYVGGLAGYNWNGTIKNSYATVIVSGSSSAGGLAGENRGTISNSYATGNVSGNDNVGGLAGQNNGGVISSSYAAGSVNGTGSSVGGLAGSNSGTISSSYYDSETSGQSGGYGTPKTTVQMQSQEIVDALNLGASLEKNNAWIYNSGKYPVLSNDKAQLKEISAYFASGNGTLGNPYIIITKEQLEILAIFTNTGHTFIGEYISLGQDIALNDTNQNGGWRNWGTSGSGRSQWTPIGTQTNQFKGTFDGKGFVISGLYINTISEYQGLFGYDSAAVIKNVGVVAGYVKGGRYTGFLAGINYRGTISNCYVNGNVSGGNSVGGLAGYNGRGTISNSYASGNVSGTGNYVGGLAGHNYGTISNSYAASIVSGDNFVGGLAGYNESEINNSYAAGNVSGDYVGGLVGYNYGTISNSYAICDVGGNNRIGGLVGDDFYGTISNSYAINTSSFLGNEKGSTLISSSSKTAEQMKRQATFVGWDFSDIWFIDENNDYPKLWWSLPDFENIIADTSDLKYTGKSVKPIITIDGLEENIHFSVKYFNNVNAGDAWAFVQGINGTIGKKTVDFAIGKVPLTATAENKTMIYGNAIPELSISYSGFVNGEKKIVLTAEPIASTTATSTSDAGDYDITLSGGSADNYEFSFENGTLTISPKQLTVANARAKNKVYDGTTAATILNAKLVGVVNGDDVFLENTGVGVFASADVGTDIPVSTAMTLGGAKANNYILTQPQISANITALTPIAGGDLSGGNFDLQVRGGSMWIAYIGNLGHTQVGLYTLNGTKIRSLSFVGEVYNVPLEDLPKGLYVVKVNFGSERIVRKVMVK